MTVGPVGARTLAPRLGLRRFRPRLTSKRPALLSILSIVNGAAVGKKPKRGNAALATLRGSLGSSVDLDALLELLYGPPNGGKRPGDDNGTIMHQHG